LNLGCSFPQLVSSGRSAALSICRSQDATKDEIYVTSLAPAGSGSTTTFEARRDSGDIPVGPVFAGLDAGGEPYLLFADGALVRAGGRTQYLLPRHANIGFDTITPVAPDIWAAAYGVNTDQGTYDHVLVARETSPDTITTLAFPENFDAFQTLTSESFAILTDRELLFVDPRQPDLWISRIGANGALRLDK
jgi:hypothetical protein